MRNVLPKLSARADVQVTAALPPDLRREFLRRCPRLKASVGVNFPRRDIFDASCKSKSNCRG